MIKKLFVYISFVIIAAGFINQWFNPTSLYWWRGKKQLIHPAVRDAAILAKELPEVGEVEFQLRGNLQRQAIYKVKKLKRGEKRSHRVLALKEFGETNANPSNYALHRASKSTLVPFDDGWFFSRDTGWASAINSKGQVLWSYGNLSAMYGFHSTAIVEVNSLFIGDYDGFLSRLKRPTGDILWTVFLGDAIGATPLLDHENFLYVNIETGLPDGYLAKIDAKTGRMIWTSSWFNTQSHSSPTLCSPEMLLLGDNLGVIRAFDTNSGKVLWSFKADDAVKGTIACMDEFAYFSSWDGHIYKLHLSGHVEWKMKLYGYNQSSIALSKNLGLGFINSELGVCQFNLDKGNGLKCLGGASSDRTRLGSPIVLQENEGREIEIWSSCGRTEVCLFKAPKFRLVKRWDIHGALSGQLSFDGSKLFAVNETTPEIHIFE